jgi:predicted lipid-binding transport protein (Tim44 family)
VTLLNAVYSPAPTPTSTSSSSTSTTPTSSTTPLISPTAPPSSHTSSLSVNIGPIAGGVVGGVAALAIIAILIFFLVRNSKKQTSPAVVMPSTSEQQQWQAGLAQPPSQHQPQRYGNNNWPHSQQDYPPSNDTDKPFFASHTNQLQSPISQQSVSDPMSYTPDSAQDRQSTFAPPYMAVGDSQMSGNQPMHELDGQAHNGNQRY